MLAIIDNYDSFTYNLAQLFGELGQDVRVFRNDAISAAELDALDPTHIVISPGPGTPQDAGVSNEVICQDRAARCWAYWAQCIGALWRQVVRAPL
jgi:anthranilate synthase component 2/para-aminobenzoate synthetase component 2